jgi:hypothetical protein
MFDVETRLIAAPPKEKTHQPFFLAVGFKILEA